jgi:hypothetical protein
VSGRPSAATIQAVRLIKKGWTAYRAAKHVGIALTTIYRSPLYKALKEKPPEGG